MLLLILAVLPLAAREKDKLPYGEGLIVNIPLPENEVELVVQDVVQNGIIRGTKEYNKDEFVSGAKAASSSNVFPAWTEGGKVFYKIREHALDPRNFKDSGDVGTLVVRYVLLAQGDKNTVLRIDALFEEDFRRTVHQSSGSVEGAEYKDIQEHLEAIEVMKQQTAEVSKEQEEQRLKKQHQPARPEGPWGPVPESPSSSSSSLSSSSQPVPAAQIQPNAVVPAGTIQPQEAASPSQTLTDQLLSGQGSSEQSVSGRDISGQNLEERVKDLRKQLERLVKAPGAPLKSAPFHTASTLQSLATGTEVLILISTPYWYGVETHEGQHGWIMRDLLEQP